MSKGNLILGMARGSVGDVTMYRMDGEQMARARNRHPKNPNSTQQAIQRAITASVGRLYSLTRVLTDHAFQGKSKGKENQRVFLKRNQAILRAQVLTAINGNLADTATDARVSAPGLSVAVPFVGAQMSSGNYPQALWEYKLNALDNPAYHLPAVAAGGETVAEYAARVGLIAGDIYTIMAVCIGTSAGGINPLYSVGDTEYAKVYQSYFDYVQFKVKDGLSANTNQMSAALTYSVLFDVVGGTKDFSGYSIVQPLAIDDISSFVSNTGCICCIRSRWDQDLRSNSFLQAGRQNAGMAYGLTPAYLLAAWRDKLGIDDVELILEGERFAGISSSDSLVVSSVSLTGVNGLTEWPDTDTQKTNSQIGSTVVVTIDGSNIANAYLNSERTGHMNFDVDADGSAATLTVSQASQALASEEFTLYINGEQYGGSLQFTT